jgi:hypothetical protein
MHIPCISLLMSDWEWTQCVVPSVNSYARTVHVRTILMNKGVPCIPCSGAILDMYAILCRCTVTYLLIT